MLRVTPLGKEVTCAEQVCVTQQKSPPAKEEHTQQDTAEQAARTTGTTTSGVSLVTHSQCAAQVTVARKTHTYGCCCFCSVLYLPDHHR